MAVGALTVDLLLTSASTAPEPKINTGTVSGRTSKASKRHRRRAPRVSADVIAPSQTRIGEPSASARDSTQDFPREAELHADNGVSQFSGKQLLIQ